MAQYMFLLFDSEEWYDNITAEDWHSTMKLHTAFAEAVEAAGASILGGAALERSSTASTVKQREGAEPLVTDGPFIETKEALGGFYLVEARDLDQALELAKLCPSGNVEVRPVMDTSAEAAPSA
ncbi:YciI family protein [Kribbella sp. NBC_01505]|uniref:YciI family protein n=1 Tax=Kribbella sp. NBC_01505 TaxID=2903580 RepID=UPI0038680DCB